MSLVSIPDATVRPTRCTATHSAKRWEKPMELRWIRIESKQGFSMNDVMDLCTEKKVSKSQLYSRLISAPDIRVVAKARAKAESAEGVVASTIPLAGALTVIISVVGLTLPLASAFTHLASAGSKVEIVILFLQ